MASNNRATSWSTNQIAELLQASSIEPIGTITHVGSGQWSDCFGFDTGDGAFVIRVGRHVDDFRKDHFAQRFAQPGLPIPELFDIGRSGAEFYAISTFAAGAPLEQLAEWHQAVAPLVELLEALRQVEPAGLVGWGRWSADGVAEASTWREFVLGVNLDPDGTRISGWSSRLAEIPDLADSFARGYEFLAASIIDDVPRSVVHNDLFNRNAHILDGHITGVFDWGNSLIGDHLYDLALLCFWSPWFNHIDEQLVLAELDRRWTSNGAMRDFDARFRVCLLHAGLEHIAYHLFLNNVNEARRVADRMFVVADRAWL